MYVYMTPSDTGRGDEGRDDEDEAMGQLFDYDMDDPSTTFDLEPDRPFALDGSIGQLIANEQLEQLTVDAARGVSVYNTEHAGLGGLGETAITPTDSGEGLPEAPEGMQWKLTGPSTDGQGYNWDTVPTSTALAPVPDAVTSVKDGCVALVTKNKVVTGAVALATVGALWWLFLRGKAGD